ncbi:hypothetical protein FBUS_06685 [Fasciolopsis buskii]|uniref:Dynein regulatory complex protein 10 n=1 Tax=Fasciolopsis buskii TaxID=27845 RepID=A0A8E0S456_9TREM|nr:hypothetical protein FBUS_06685 [Fasciolopsis buski]
MSSTAIPCQKFNTADELKTLSRSVLSGDARRMLGVLDSAMRKILLVFALENTNITYLDNDGLDGEAEKAIKKYLKLSQQYSSGRIPVTEKIHMDIASYTPAEQQREESYVDAAEKNGETPNVGSEYNGNEKPDMTKMDEENESSAGSEAELKEHLLLAVRRLLRVIKNSPRFANLTENYLTVKPRSSCSLPDLKLPLSVSNFPEACSQAYLSDMLSRPQSHLMRYFLKLRSNIFSNMLTTPQDSKRKKKYLKEICNRLNEQQIKVDCLTSDLEILTAKNNEQTLEEEYLQIMEERRLEEERKQREEEQRKALEQAVCTIQAYWRSYKTRKMARSKRGGRGRK